MNRIVLLLALVAAVHSYAPYPVVRQRRMQPDIVIIPPIGESSPEVADTAEDVVPAKEDASPVAPPRRPGFLYPPFFSSFPSSFGFGGGFGGAGFGGAGFGDRDTRPYGGFDDFFFGTAFFRRLEETLRNMQREIDTLVHSSRNNGTSAGGVLDIGELPPNYKNTTSTTKVVDGKLVTVNDTIHKSSNNNAHSFFHVRVIDVHPQQRPTGPTPGEVESLVPLGTEQPAFPDRRPDEENEIVGAKPAELRSPGLVSRSSGSLPLSPTNAIDGDGDIEEIKVERPIDLSSDIRVNQLLADDAKAGKLFRIDPDAEVVEVVDGRLVEGSSRNPYAASQHKFSEQFALPIGLRAPDEFRTVDI